ncbi:MAG: excinuclease ABC subunit UvrA [Chloroflexota bacterium]|nr:excinuclease ABC subunit UvrA [Chloroflexota bacterium]
MQNTITIKGARLHNLKNITLSIPKNRLVVLTGLSGSGKSTLAFDTLHKEGQRQYMESLGLVTSYLSKPPIDSIKGLSPSISVDQHLTNRSPRSTVGTVTEVYTYLRVLYARIGHRPCPACGANVPPSYDVGDVGRWDDEPNGHEPDAAFDGGDTYPCRNCGAPMPELGMAHFSFNKPAGACPTCTGLGVVLQPRLDRLIDSERSILEGAIHGWDIHYIEHYTKTLHAAGRYYGFDLDLGVPIKELGPVQRDLLLHGVNSAQFRRHYPDIEPPHTVSKGRFEGVVTNLLRRYRERANDAAYREKMEKLLSTQVCLDCEGTRLRMESRRVTVAGQTIVALSRMPLDDLADWLERLAEVVSPEEWIITEPIVDDLRERVRRLLDVGVGYLTMERSSPTLSAGEAQRLRLASLLGSGLTGVLYVLDEPTIGLHPRDTERLIRVLCQLRDLGNTVLVVEHDLEMIRAADYVVDMGPGAGEQGGHVVVAGSPQVVSDCADSVTGQYLARRASVSIPDQRRPGSGEHLVIRGAREHNLQDITVSLPLGSFIAVTGVSGSGKSSLMLDVLDRAARQRFYGTEDTPGEHDAITGWEHLDKIVTIDQTAIGRTPRSNTATYTDAFGPIRQAFAKTDDASEQGLTASHFSFNVPDGRCGRCQGAGVLTVNMHMLPDVQVRCPVCRGRRFKREVLAVKYRGHDVASVLDMTIEEALALFQDVPAVVARLSLTVDVGLGYLKLGQPATTLSGGEAQRVKLAKELGRRATGRTLYLLDEPTTGLHVADVARLLTVLQRLVEAGNTVVVIEHNLDVIKAVDWIIDLGPEGGKAGGQIVAQGTPEQITQVKASHTGTSLLGSGMARLA